MLERNVEIGQVVVTKIEKKSATTRRVVNERNKAGSRIIGA